MKQPPGDLHFPLKHNPGRGPPDVLRDWEPGLDNQYRPSQNGVLNPVPRPVPEVEPVWGLVNLSIPQIRAAPSSTTSGAHQPSSQLPSALAWVSGPLCLPGWWCVPAQGDLVIATPAGNE